MKDVASELLPFSSNKEQSTRNQEHSPSLRPGEFWANKDISFELRRGECIGLIGKNGAGKTTLLKMLNGLIKPDSGTIEMRGRVGALIALGAGFNPILTGRENIYVNGSILGLSKQEITEKIEEIIDFAEIRDFIDSPVQSYSSGMQVRLGFAVATAMNPDILILDEVLAVGDVGFRTKCYNRIYEVCKTAAVIFVSHNMPQVDRLCSRALVLSGGKVAFDGDTESAIDQYNRLFDSETRGWNIADGVEIHSVLINGNDPGTPIDLQGNDPLEIVVDLTLPARARKTEMSASFLERSYDQISQANTRFSGISPDSLGSRQVLRMNIPEVLLGSGLKLLSVAISDAESNEILFWAFGGWSLVIRNPCFIPSPSFLHSEVSVELPAAASVG